MAQRDQRLEDPGAPAGGSGTGGRGSYLEAAGEERRARILDLVGAAAQGGLTAFQTGSVEHNMMASGLNVTLPPRPSLGGPYAAPASGFPYGSPADDEFD